MKRQAFPESDKTKRASAKGDDREFVNEIKNFEVCATYETRLVGLKIVLVWIESIKLRPTEEQNVTTFYRAFFLVP